MPDGDRDANRLTYLEMIATEASGRLFLACTRSRVRMHDLEPLTMPLDSNILE